MGKELVNYDCWRIAQPQTNYKKDKKCHPAQKSLELLRRIILIGSNEGDLVLDPFAGSGTTGVACRQLNRNFILIERDRDMLKLFGKD
jgi:DNA modification methylase